jgi:hypothetical protein
VYRSRFLPRFLGVWLAVGGFANVILSLTGLLLPQYQDKVFTYSQPAFFGKIALMLWLIIKGARPPSAGRDSLIVGGWLGCISWVVGDAKITLMAGKPGKDR